MAEDNKLIYAGMLVLIAALVVAFFMPSIKPPQNNNTVPTPTPLPTFTYQTAVTLYLDWIPGGDPEIVSINSWRVTQYVVQEPEDTGLSWFPWGGTIKLQVLTPSNKMATMTKEIKIESGETKTFYFTWTTSETGKHTITVTLINGEGVVVGQKTTEVMVYG